MLAAQVIINLALAIVALGIIVVAGTLAYGLGTPKQPAGFILSLLLTIAAMFTIGLWISAFARSAAVASGIGQLILYPSLFFAGLGLPREVMPGVLRDIGDWTPLGATVQAMQSSMQGTFPSAQLLLVMLAYALLFGCALLPVGVNQAEAHCAPSAILFRPRIPPSREPGAHVAGRGTRHGTALAAQTVRSCCHWSASGPVPELSLGGFTAAIA